MRQRVSIYPIAVDQAATGLMKEFHICCHSGHVRMQHRTPNILRYCPEEKNFLSAFSAPLIEPGVLTSQVIQELTKLQVVLPALPPPDSLSYCCLQSRRRISISACRLCMSLNKEDGQRLRREVMERLYGTIASHDEEWKFYRGI